MVAVREPPPALLSQYTMDGRVPLEFYYVDEAAPTNYTFALADLEHYLATAKHRLRSSRAIIYTPESSRGDEPPQRGGGSSTQWLARAVVEHVRDGDAVVVYGSTEPWAEALALAAGAANTSTVEFSVRNYKHPQMFAWTVDELARAVRAGDAPRFDVGIAHAAFDHDGLGRYGDPLRPDGDLLAMRTAWEALRPGGTLLLSVPVGPDVCVWNLHRRYGERRLPRLLAGWERVGRVGWDEARLTAPSDHRRRYEPVLALRRGAEGTGPLTGPPEVAPEVADGGEGGAEEEKTEL